MNTEQLLELKKWAESSSGLNLLVSRHAFMKVIGLAERAERAEAALEEWTHTNKVDELGREVDRLRAELKAEQERGFRANSTIERYWGQIVSLQDALASRPAVDLSGLKRWRVGEVIQGSHPLDDHAKLEPDDEGEAVLWCDVQALLSGKVEAPTSLDFHISQSAPVSAPKPAGENCGEPAAANADDRAMPIPGDIVRLKRTDTINGQPLNRGDAWLVNDEYLRVANEQAARPTAADAGGVPGPRIVKLHEMFGGAGVKPEAVGRWDVVPLAFGDGSVLTVGDPRKGSSFQLVHFSDYKTAQCLAAAHNAALDARPASTAGDMQTTASADGLPPLPEPKWHAMCTKCGTDTELPGKVDQHICKCNYAAFVVQDTKYTGNEMRAYAHQARADAIYTTMTACIAYLIDSGADFSEIPDDLARMYKERIERLRNTARADALEEAARHVETCAVPGSIAERAMQNLAAAIRSLNKKG